MRKGLAALLLSLSFALSLSSPSWASRRDEGVRLDILFTNDVQGYIEPCG